MNSIVLAACAALAATPSEARQPETAQRGSPSNSLARALAAFSAADADHDGKISAEEARAIPVSAADLARDDLEGDGSWSRDEFTLHYRRRLVAGGQAVGSDLDAEVARIQALKRVRVIEEARKQSEVTPGGSGGVEPVGVRLEKALGDLEKSAAARKASPQDFRRLKNLVILSGRSVPEFKDDSPASTANAKVLQALERIEKRAAAGQYVRADFDALRTFVSSRPGSSEVARSGREEPGRRPSDQTPPGVVAPPANPGGAADRSGGPIRGPADARRRADDSRGSGRVGPKGELRPAPGKAPAPKPAPVPDKKKDPDRSRP